MKLFHISDLHIGIKIYGMSQIEEQRHILNTIVQNAVDERIDGIILAGDIYDKQTPSAEGVVVFDEFLTALSKNNISVFMIWGNHDSKERIAFGSSILKDSNIYISPVYNGTVSPITLTDEYGNINIYLLPFLKPQYVRAFADTEIPDYNSAIEYAISTMGINKAERNIIVSHQFVTGASTCESEEISIGGTDNISADLFSDFDYTALGHIHRPQKIKSEYIRYSGTPLKYSFSEENDKKAITVIELKEKGDIKISQIPLTPIHDMRTIKGEYDTLMSRKFYSSIPTDDYIRVILTDEMEIPYAIEKMRGVYPNILELRYDNRRTQNTEAITAFENAEKKTALELFSEFYQKQNGAKMSDEEECIIKDVLSDLEVE